jgi:hypothetical protein
MLLVKNQGYLVDGVDVLCRDDLIHIHTAKQGYLLLDILRQKTVGPAQENIGLDANAPKLFYAVLGGLCFHLASRLYIWDQRQVDVKDIFFSHV